jgi:hypothetical protein
MIQQTLLGDGDQGGKESILSNTPLAQRGERCRGYEENISGGSCMG